MKTVTGSATESYNYDDVGNRTSSHLSATYGYPTAPHFNRVTSFVSSGLTTSFGYDANGNVATKSEGSNFWRYGWDHENRLVTASTRKNSVRYKYDALGRRIERNLGTGRERTKFTYDGDDVILDDNSGTLTKYLNGEGIDNRLRATTGSNASYFLADSLGSTNGLADLTGAVTSQTAYDSFGNTSNTAFPSRYQFTGREFDSFTQMQFSRARWYDPKIGRFISEDPIGFGGGDVNLYGYVGSSPIGLTDPSGHLPIYSLPKGKDVADALDRGVDALTNLIGDPIVGTTPGVHLPIRLSAKLKGPIDLLRVGFGTGCAMNSPDMPAYRKFELYAQDYVRAGTLFVTMASPFSGRFGAGNTSVGRQPVLSGREAGFTISLQAVDGISARASTWKRVLDHILTIAANFQVRHPASPTFTGCQVHLS